MTRFIGLACLGLLLVGCSSTSTPPRAPITTPATVSTITTPTPSDTTTTTDFSTDELALLNATGYTPSDSDAASFIDQAHGLCDNFAPLSDEDIFTAMKDSEMEKRITAGKVLLLLCKEPRYTPLLVAVDIPGAVASGTYYVGKREGQLPPGSYKTIGAVTDCYWVRRNKAGDIIDNKLVTNAPGGLRLTVKASDYEVEMDSCGIWIPNK